MGRVLLFGNPNVGKTTLFNRWTGGRARVGNYPGITVDVRQGRARLPGGAGTAVDLVDLPGTYSLRVRSEEERIAVDELLRAGDDAAEAAGSTPTAAVVVVDGTALARSLYLALEVIEFGLPTVVAVNLVDELRAEGQRLDRDDLARQLGVPVVPIAARRGEGTDELLGTVQKSLQQSLDDRGAGEPSAGDAVGVRYGPHVESAVDAVRRALVAAGAGHGEKRGGAARLNGLARWALLTGADGLATPAGAPVRGAGSAPARAGVEPHRHPSVVEAVRAAEEAARGQGHDLELDLVAARYARVDELVGAAVHLAEATSKRRAFAERVDAVLTHRVAGLVVFALVMAAMFQALFSWSEPLMGMIETAVTGAQDVVGAALPPGPFRGLVVDGVLGGVGNVVVFVPQIALLFLFVGALEASGYLARVAFVIDRIMGAVGLHGRAFVPMLSGFACAVPAVMATRTLESHRDRLLTMMVVPLMSCSARLPVYVLITATVFSPEARVFGVLSLGAMVLFGMYALSVAGALGAAAVLRRTVLRGPRPTLVLELPKLRRPVLGDLLRSTWDRVRSFLVDAGTIILALTIVLWALLSYPVSPETTAQLDDQREAARADLRGDALDRRLAALDDAEATARLRGSAAGTLGRALEPMLEPLGFDWRLGVGIVGAFAAREVFVSTLGVVFGVGDAADEESEGLRSELRAAQWPDGRPLMTPLVGVSLMVFFVFAAQCMSTLAVIRRESGSTRWAVFVFGYMTALAWIASLVVYQGGRALGFG